MSRIRFQGGNTREAFKKIGNYFIKSFFEIEEPQEPPPTPELSDSSDEEEEYLAPLKSKNIGVSESENIETTKIWDGKQLIEMINTRQPFPLLVVGPPASGKTTLTKQLIKTIMEFRGISEKDVLILNGINRNEYGLPMLYLSNEEKVFELLEAINDEAIRGPMIIIFDDSTGMMKPIIRNEKFKTLLTTTRKKGREIYLILCAHSVRVLSAETRGYFRLCLITGFIPSRELNLISETFLGSSDAEDTRRIRYHIDRYCSSKKDLYQYLILCLGDNTIYIQNNTIN